MVKDFISSVTLRSNKWLGLNSNIRGEFYSVRGNGLQPVIVEIKQDHLRLCGLQNEVSKLLHFQTGLERQLKLRAFDYNVGEVQQVHLRKTDSC